MPIFSSNACINGFCILSHSSVENSVTSNKKACNNKGAADLMSELIWIIWDHVGVVQTPMGLTHTVSLVLKI